MVVTPSKGEGEWSCLVTYSQVVRMIDWKGYYTEKRGKKESHPFRYNIRSSGSFSTDWEMDPLFLFN